MSGIVVGYYSGTAKFEYCVSDFTINFVQTIASGPSAECIPDILSRPKSASKNAFNTASLKLQKHALGYAIVF